MAIYALGPFSLDAKDGLLLQGREPVAVGRRAIALLRALVEQPGALLSKGALIEAGWSGQSVEESNLTVQIAALRRALGTTPGGASWIETMPGRGYRFIGPVVAEAGKSAPEKSAPPRLSIVVLPFANIGGDLEQEHFVDGITESLTSDLSRIRGALVIARNTAFTYKGKPADAKQIGRELNVRYVLEGSVQRGGNRIRVNVQLIDADAGNHLWAERFDKALADLFDMQDEIVARLANALNAQLTVAEARHAEPGEVERERALEPPLPATRSVDEGEGRGPEWRFVAALAAELVPEAGGRMPSDPEDLSVIIAGFRHQAATVVTQYGGVIGERRGCEIVAYFGFPHAQENDGERAVRAALAIQRALVDLNARNAATGAPELAARIGLDSGRVVVDSIRRGLRRGAQRRRAGAERRGARRNLDHAGRAPADRGPVRRRGQGRARAERRARKGAALPHRARQRRRAARRLARADAAGRPRRGTRHPRAPLGARAPRRGAALADRRRAGPRQIAADRGVPRPAGGDAAHLGRVGVLAAAAEHAAASRSRNGAAPASAAPKSPAKSASPNSRRRSARSGSTPPNMRRCSRR